MPIFRYTLKKILVSPSTWVIFILTIVVLGLCWALPIALFSIAGDNISWTKDLVLLFFYPTWKLLAFTGFIGLMLLIFIGAKATQIFRDEIDDGTLLILVSKPISRNRIWFEKWLSFQTTVIFYIFFTILIGGLLLIIPGVGGTVVYLALLPYMGILFGIGLLFDLIFTSIVLLLSLVLNSKATIAITIGFAALVNIFSQAIDPIIVIPATYFQLSQGVTVFHDLERKSSNDDINWFKQQLADQTNYVQTIEDLMQKVYDNDISNVNYPTDYDPIAEQKVVPEIIAAGVAGSYTQEDIDNLKRIVSVSDVFRQWKEQSYVELMTSVQVGQNKQRHGFATPGNNGINYGAVDVMNALNLKISQQNLDDFNNKITQKRVMRYFNVFYQLFYLWNGVWGDNASLYVSVENYERQDDPVLISFDKVNNDQYQVNANSGKHKILDFPILVTFYVVLGVFLLGTSWYVFNRKDFA